jgi:type I restriction enzyme S subunit
MDKEESKYKLPEGWIGTSIGDILSLEYGKSLPLKLRKSEGKYPVYGSSGKIGYHNEPLIKGPAIIVGRKGSVGVVNYEKEDCWPIDTTYFIKTVNSLNIRFIFYLLRTLNLNELDSSTAIPGINRNNVYEKKILLPSLNEQSRIVSRIEELFSELDYAELGLKKAQKQLEIFRQSLLKSAFEGNISKKWREENNPESAVSLLEQLNNEREKTYQRKLIDWESEITIKEKNGKIGLKPLKPKLNKNIVCFEKGVTENIKIPINWFFSTFDSITENYDELRVPLSQNDRQMMKGNYPYYGATKIIDYVNDYIFDGRFILIGEDGANLLSKNKPLAFIVEGKFWVNNHTHIIRTSEDEVLMKYLMLFFNTLNLSSFITGTAQPKLNKNRLNSIPVPICSIKEQKIIVQELESRFTLIENLNLSINIGLQKTEVFKQIILKKAFEGNLLPQDSTDSPSLQLLKQIKIEKEAYVKGQKEAATSKPKTKSVMEKKKTILEILKESSEPISAKELWIKSIHKEDVEDFYAELKEIYLLINETKKGVDSFLSYKK